MVGREGLVTGFEGLLLGECDDGEAADAGEEGEMLYAGVFPLS